MSPDELHGQVARSAAVERELREQLQAVRAELEQAKRRIAEIEDIDIARLQLPDGRVPGNTVECARMWHAEAQRFWKERDELQAALTNETARREQLAERVLKMDQELVETRTRAHAAEDALRDLFGLVDSGALVRNVAKDSEPGYALEAMKMVMALKRAQDALAGKPGGLQTAALAACAYLAAHKALADAGTSPERPAAARRLADAWIALNKACEEIRPALRREAQPDPLPGIPPIDHDFVPNPWPARDECDKRVSDDADGRNGRQCGRPRREHQA